MNNLDTIKDNDIIEGVLAEFAELAKIPRPSGHEKAVSDYLFKLFSDMGCTVVQDAVNNIIADLPATAGCEEKPLTVMQAHMDMVCVAADGVAYDPLHDPIKLVREGDLLTADGTSLGADDGMGIAIIVYIMKNLACHGPLRAIITVDEETGMTGASNLAAEHFQGVSYLINCDSEDWDMLTVGSAGSGDLTFTRKYAVENAPAGTAYALNLSGLKGGHSGTEINCGVANALKVMGFCLDTLRTGLRDFHLAAMQGGSAKNVIPSKAEAVFYTAEPMEKVQGLVRQAFAEFKGIFGNVEEDAALDLARAESVAQCVDAASGDGLIDILLCMPNGVSAMSQICEGMVETSANLGVVEIDADSQTICLKYMPRSSKEEAIRQYYAVSEVLGKLTGFTVEQGVMFPTWTERKESRLSELMQQVFAEQNGQKMRVTSIHAGLECSWHLQRNPAMDVVSIGTNNKDIHSPQETLELKTVPPQVRLIAETLQRI